MYLRSACSRKPGEFWESHGVHYTTRSPTWVFRPEDKKHKYNSTNSIEKYDIKFMLTDIFIADDELFGKRSNPVANQPAWEFFVG